jgi:hypothetical protein
MDMALTYRSLVKTEYDQCYLLGDLLVQIWYRHSPGATINACVLLGHSHQLSDSPRIVLCPSFETLRNNCPPKNEMLPVRQSCRRDGFIVRFGIVTVET